MKNYDFVEAEFGVACQFLQTEIAHSGSNEDDMDPTWYPATILWASLRYADRAYWTDTWIDLRGVHSYKREFISTEHKRVQSVQEKHATPEESSTNPTGIWGGSYMKISGRMEWSITQEVPQRISCKPFCKGKNNLAGLKKNLNLGGIASDVISAKT